MRLLISALVSTVLFGEGAFSKLSLEQALVKAGKNNQIVLIDFYTTWCGPCKLLDSTTWKDEKVITFLKQNTISLKIDAEKELALSKKYSITGYPTILLLKPDGKVIDRMVGYQKPDAFIVSVQNSLKGITALDRARTAVSNAHSDDLRGQVNARYELARILMDHGHNEEALKEYLWLYDDGMKRDKGSIAVRNSFLISDLQRLSLHFSPALEALRQRRDTARALFLRSPGDSSSAQDLFSLNHALKDDTDSLETFDQLPPDSPGRKTLGSQLWNELINQKRYTDAFNAKPTMDILNEISRQESFLPPDPALQKIIRSNWLKSIASGIEVLIGTERFDEVKILVKKALTIDPSSGTISLIKKHIQRTGKEFPLDSLH